MIIENTDALKAWLAVTLRPLCDADPAALSKYVLALIKKDKPDSELRQIMFDQLEVFLQQETVNFVNLLFDALDSNSYLNTIIEKVEIKTEQSPSESNEIALENGTETTSPVPEEPSDLAITEDEDMEVSKLTDSLEISSSDLSSTVNITDDTLCSDSSNKTSPRKDRLDKDSKSRRNKSRSPTRRSRSRSRDRNHRAFSPKEHQRPGHYRGRPGLRRSPDRRYGRDVWDRLERRRSPGARNRSPSPRTRSRTPPRYRRNFDSNRARSRSPLDRNRSPVRGTHRTPDISEVKPSLQSAVVKASDPTGRSENHQDSSGEFNGSGSSAHRCKDFDERGLCMRGELCPYDHGQNPVVLQDVPHGVQMKDGSIPPAFGAVEPPDFRLMRPARPILGMDPGMMEMPWNPMPPFGPRGRGGMMIPRPLPFPMLPQRELINIPVMGAPPSMNGMVMEHEMGYPPIHPMGMFPRGMQPVRGRGRGRGGFDHSRLGLKTKNYTNCSLEVRRIPKGLNTISELNGHFVQFGKIVNIQINFENDPEAALITFSTPAEAMAAYKSTEAVLNNRFIKVFWHKKEKENEEAANELRMSVRERLGEQVEVGEDGKPIEQTEGDRILLTGNSVTKTMYNANAQKKEISAEKVQAVEAIKKSQEQLAAQEQMKKLHQEKKKEAMKLLNDLQKKRQSMLLEQIDQQKKLISKYELGKNQMTQEEKDELMKLIKSLQDSIETLRAK